MRALKFLARGAVAPFMGVRWPAPAGGLPGAWVEAASTEPGRGVHACRVEDLAYWLNDELWEVELDGEVVAGPTLLEARRGRLVRRVEAWSKAAALAYAAACTERTRERSASVLDAAGLPAAAGCLRAARDNTSMEALPSIAEVAAASRAAELASYLADAALRVRTGRAMSATFVNAVAAAALDLRPEAFDEERRTQSLLLGRQLGLSGL